MFKNNVIIRVISIVIELDVTLNNSERHKDEHGEVCIALLLCYGKCLQVAATSSVGHGNVKNTLIALLK